MPKSLVEVRYVYSPPEEEAILAAVHESLVAGFLIPVEDRSARLVVHEPHRFTVSPGLTQPERYTMVTIECFAGRSLDAKRRLYREIVERLEPLGIPRDHVTIVLHEIPLESWGGFGGLPASDVDLGFDVNV